MYMYIYYYYYHHHYYYYVYYIYIYNLLLINKFICIKVANSLMTIHFFT